MARAEQPDGKKTVSGRVIAGHIDDWDDLAVDYLDGTLDAATKTAIDAHLETCSNCAARLGVQQAVSNVLKHVDLEEVPADLEDRILGEIVFPSEPVRTIRAAAAERAPWAQFWRKRLRPWIPATVAVVALFIALIGFGVFRGETTSELAATTTAGASVALNGTERASGDTAAETATTAAAAATTVTVASVGQGGAGESHQEDGGVPGATQPPTVGSEGPITTAADTFGAALGTEQSTTTTTTHKEVATAIAATVQDNKQMIAEIRTADSPLYFVFEASDTEASGAATVDLSRTELADQITTLTGLKPVGSDLALGGPTFVAYIPKEDATAIVELLQSIGASLRLTVSLAREPVNAPIPSGTADYASALRAHRAQFPELDAQKKPPSVSAYTYTTSTLAQTKDSGSPTSWVAPDEAGTHALIVIYLGE